MPELHVPTLRFTPLLCAACLFTSPALAQDAPSWARGGWSDRVDLDLPPGPGNLTPDLAIVHEHTRQDGTLGTGFALTGHSSITRHSPTGGVPTRDGDSLFRLDGQPLVRVDHGGGLPSMASVPLDAGNAADHHFEPARFNSARLRYDPEENTWTKETSGWTWVYGGQEAHATERKPATRRAGPTIVLPCGDGTDLCTTTAWHLSRTLDPAGNEITYDYRVPDLPPSLAGRFGLPDTGQFLLDTIRWAGGRAEVSLSYETRPDPRFQANTGAEKILGHRLTGVTSTVGGGVFSDYRIEYKDQSLDGEGAPSDCDGQPLPAEAQLDLETAPLQTLLRRVVRVNPETGGRRVMRCVDTHHATPTWPEGEDLGAAVEIPEVLVGSQPLGLDLDGDAVTDLLVLDRVHLRQQGLFLHGAWHPRHRAYIATPGGAAAFVNRETATGEAAATISAWEDLLEDHLRHDLMANERGYLIGDLAGRGKPVVLAERAASVGDDTPGLVFQITPSGAETPLSTLPPCQLRAATLGDVNGDGLTDLIRPAHAATDDCPAAAQSSWVANTGVFPYFDWEVAQPLHVPLESTSPPEDWASLQAACSKKDLDEPPADYNDRQTDSAPLVEHARLADLNQDGVLDIAHAVHACFAWKAPTHGTCGNYWAAQDDSLYSRIHYGRGDGTFVDSGLHAGDAIVEYDALWVISSGDHLREEQPGGGETLAMRHGEGGVDPSCGKPEEHPNVCPLVLDHVGGSEEPEGPVDATLGSHGVVDEALHQLLGLLLGVFEGVTLPVEVCKQFVPGGEAFLDQGVQVRPALDVRRRKIVLAGPILGRSGDAA